MRSFWRSLSYYDENVKKINHLIKERKEQILCSEFIEPSCTVLELGARYGMSSCVINTILDNKEAHVAVEPDSRVWEALEGNRARNNCKFHILKGVISEKNYKLVDTDYWYGYGTRTEEVEESDVISFPLSKIQEIYNLKFDTLVADCEGFLQTFFEENPLMYKQLRLVIFELDCPKICNYKKIIESLQEHGFVLVGGMNAAGKGLFRQCWRKNILDT